MLRVVSVDKDSLAAIHVRMEHNEPVDYALYCRIMFDDAISAEWPEHEEWIHGYAIPLLESRYGIKTEVVSPKHTYCNQFYRPYTKGKKIGRIYGWPTLMAPWCTSDLKRSTLKQWQKGQGDYIAITGLADDEKRRVVRKGAQDKIMPLVDYGISEREAFDVCRKADLLSPAYRMGRKRLGCWFCHNQTIPSLKLLRKEYSHLWSRLMQMERDCGYSFQMGGKSLERYDTRFAFEDRQMSLFDEETIEDTVIHTK